MYATKIANRITVSKRLIEPLSGIVNEYSVAAPSATTSRACPRPSCNTLPRVRIQKMKNTADQPMPISSRFAPVMFATANGAYSGSCPAFHANARSTAYSGSTATNAMNATASACEMSTSAASAAQASRNAAATIASPYSAVSVTSSMWLPVTRRYSAGAVTSVASVMRTRAWRMSPPRSRATRPRGAGPGQRPCRARARCDRC